MNPNERATAVQIAEYDGGRRKIVAHVGSAHTEAELGILLERAREMLADPAQGSFDLGIEPVAPPNCGSKFAPLSKSAASVPSKHSSSPLVQMSFAEVRTPRR